MFFDLTHKMFEAVKSPIVADTFWSWVRGLPVAQGNNVSQAWLALIINTDVEDHEIHLYADHVELVERLPYTGGVIVDRMDTTGFGRLLAIETMDDLPQWSPDVADEFEQPHIAGSATHTQELPLELRRESRPASGRWEPRAASGRHESRAASGRPESRAASGRRESRGIARRRNRGAHHARAARLARSANF